MLHETFPAGYGTTSVPNLRDWRRQNDVFESIAAYQYESYSIRSHDEPARVSAVSSRNRWSRRNA